MKFLRYASPSGPAYGVLEADGTVYALEGSPLGEHRRGAAVGPVDSLKLLVPVEPPKVICVGMNYADHVAESNAKMPTFPLYFMKPRTALVEHGGDIIYPKDSTNVHYEAEFTIVIGKTGRRIPESEALSYVLGYTIANDVSARDWQRKEMAEGFLLHGKGFDTFAPIGPVVDTGVDGSDLAIELRLNGEVKQKSRTSQLIFNIPTLISDISQFVTLEPGDVILTGTTSGVGPMKPGDVVEIEVEGIGVLRNSVVAEAQMPDMFVAASAAVADELSVAGLSVAITGGGAGVGRMTGTILARRGAKVTLADIRPERIDEALATIKAEGDSAEGIVADVSTPAGVQQVIDRAVQAHGRLDVMVNAAGIIHVIPFLEIKPEQFEALMAVNVSGTFYGTQLAARQMIAQSPNHRPGEVAGRVINFTSPSAEANSWDQTVYSMSKAAVNRLTGGAAPTLWREHGICVSALKPYAIPSPMLQGIFEAREEQYGLQEGEPARARARQLVHGRFEPLETHAEVIVWMCAAPPESINGRYVTSVPHTAAL